MNTIEIISFQELIMGRKRVVVTGGSGFVGALLRTGLIERGYDVVVYDRLRGVLINALRRKYLGTKSGRLPRALAWRSNRYLRRAERILLQYNLIRPTSDDILNIRSRITDRFRGSYAVIHLAALPHPHVPGAIDADYWRINFDGSVNVFEAAKDAAVQKFIFASSGQVYGINNPVKIDQFPILETNYCPSLDEGQNLYGHLKLKFEEWMASHSQSENPQAIALRLEFPGIRSTFPHNFYISTSIENMIDGFACALESDLASFEAFNVADAHVDPQVADIQKFIKDKWPAVPNRAEGNQCLLGTEKARSMIGYNPINSGNYIHAGLVW